MNRSGVVFFYISRTVFRFNVMHYQRPKGVVGYFNVTNLEGDNCWPE